MMRQSPVIFLFNKAALAGLVLLLTFSINAAEIRAVTYVVKTLNEEKCIADLLEFTGNNKGFMVHMRKGYFSAYVSAETSSETVEKQLKLCGLNVEKKETKSSPIERSQDLKVQIASREKHLEEVRAVLESAEFGSTLEIEKELGEIIQVLQQLKGEYSYLRERSTLLKLDVQFQATAERARGPEPSVPWMAEIGLPRFLEKFK